MTEEKTTEKTPAIDPDTGQPAGVPQLTINDMIVLKNMVEITQARGAFKADEMATVGTVYNKLKAFLDSLPKPEGEPAPTPQAPATEMPANAPAVEPAIAPEGETK